MESKRAFAQGLLLTGGYIIREVRIEAKTEPDERKKIKENEAESMHGLLKIWEEYLKMRGLDANAFSKIPGLGRQLTDEELSEVGRV